MGYAKAGRRRYLIDCTAAAAMVFLLASACASQTMAPRQPENSWSQDLNKYPGLLPEFGVLIDKLKQNVQFPPVRHRSDLLPLLSSSTGYYAAFPNYGDAAHQALTIFRQELQESSVLRDWWQHGELAQTGPQLEGFLEKFYGLSQYLGDEIVVSGDLGGKDRNFLVVTEARKPGFKDFLQQMLKELPDKSKAAVRILGPEELVDAKDRSTAQDLVVLVRPDFVVAARSVDAVQRFNSLLEMRSGQFVSTPFGQRLEEAYQEGTTALAAADLQKIMGRVPPGTQSNQMMLDRSGFKDVKYAVWNRKSVDGKAASEMELSFLGPRHGVASWLAAPATLGSLDFVSPKAVLVSTLVLKNLAEVFDDIKDLTAYSSNPNALAMLPAMEQMMHISLKDDLLGQLQGEITLELKDLAETQPAWAAILRVNDAERLQKTLEKLFLIGQVRMLPSEEDEGVTYHAVLVPSSPKPRQLSYAFVDGYLTIASSHELAAEAIRLHKSGESLAKSARFQASLPPGYPLEASALLYEDPLAMTALQLRQISPEMAGTISNLSPTTAPIVFRAYGEESAIRGVSAGGGADASTVLIVAAIAIPNLLRARIAVNEASAVGTLRTVNVAQVSYYSSYPQKGYARDLATLGPDPRGPGFASTAHASLIDATLGNASCTAGAWCSKSGYQFSIRAVCKLQSCKEFVVVATPVTSGTGTRSFCSASDAVIRFMAGPPLTVPISGSECRQWSPLQ